jgi:hypothetical protein
MPGDTSNPPSPRAPADTAPSDEGNDHTQALPPRSAGRPGEEPTQRWG